MKLPYDDSKAQDWFTKEKDFILWEKGNRDPVMAGLFLPYFGATEYTWMEKSTGRCINGCNITHYMVIPD